MLFEKIFSFFSCQQINSVDRIILGIGNPGEKYVDTRHNLGFAVVDNLAKDWNISFNKEHFRSLIAFHQICNKDVLLVKPLTYVNLSGEAAKKMLDYFQLDNQSLLVVVDDISLPVGKNRLRLKGSSGGHNGLKSIIRHLDSECFARLRMGIGENKDCDLVSHVLSRFSDEELPIINDAIVSAKEMCQQWLCQE